MQIEIRQAQSPQRGGAHLPSARRALLDAVAEVAHIVEKKIGVRVIRAVIERGDRARAGVQRGDVALIASDAIENRLALIRVGGDRRARRRGEQRHELRDRGDVVAGVVEIGTRIE